MTNDYFNDDTNYTYFSVKCIENSVKLNGGVNVIQKV